VLVLFPEDWYTLFDALRARDYDGAFGPGTYHKFSSMGNGTTFVIETLIFAAACSAVGADVWSVYGDDIAISTDKAEALAALLHFLGFDLNADKSYTDPGFPFRESCGADWYEGRRVTPFYIRDVKPVKSLLAHLVNGIVSLGRPGGQLWEEARDLTKVFRLPCCPFNGMSPSGVWVDPHTAWTKKLVRCKKNGSVAWIPTYQALVPCSLTEAKGEKDSEGTPKRSAELFLWHLGKNHRSVRKPRPAKDLIGLMRQSWLHDSEPNQWDGLSMLRYERRRLCWRPTTDVPVHLYGWSDFLYQKR
jgi:hypothetical protein